MKYIMTVSSDKKGSWTEDYTDPDVANNDDALAMASEMIDSFNRTLRPGEEPRTLISAVVVEGSEDAEGYTRKCSRCDGSGDVCYNCDEGATNCGCGDDEDHDTCSKCGGRGEVIFV